MEAPGARAALVWVLGGVETVAVVSSTSGRAGAESPSLRLSVDAGRWGSGAVDEAAEAEGSSDTEAEGAAEATVLHA